MPKKNKLIPHKTYLSFGQNLRIVEFKSQRAFKRFTDKRIDDEGLYYAQNRLVADDVKRDRRNNFNEEWAGAAESFEETQNPKRFKHLNLLKDIRKEVSKDLRKFVEYEDDFALERKKLDYNDREIGVFSFDRAAMGLRRGKVDGKIKIVSDIRKSFAWHVKKNNTDRAVKIFMISGGSAGVTKDQMIYTSMAGVLLSQTLVEMGYSVEVNCLMEVGVNKGDGVVGLIRVKKIEDDLNVNDLMMVTGDARYFRYTGFRGLIAMLDAVGLQARNSIGSTVNSVVLKQALFLHLKEDAPILLPRARSRADVLRVIKEAIGEVTDTSPDPS